MKEKYKNIIIIVVSVLTCSVAVGIMPRCSDLQTIAEAKEQHQKINKKIDDNEQRNEKIHDKIFDELKEQRSQQQKTLDRIIEMLKTRGN